MVKPEPHGFLSRDGDAPIGASNTENPYAPGQIPLPSQHRQRGLWRPALLVVVLAAVSSLLVIRLVNTQRARAIEMREAAQRAAEIERSRLRQQLDE